MKKSILVIEDDSVTISLTRKMLVEAGYRVDAAMESNHAIKMLTSNNYDLIILDISMPILNGFDFVELLESFEIETKIIFFTNLSDETTLKKVSKLNVERLVSKKTNFHQLPEIVNEIIGP